MVKQIFAAEGEQQRRQVFLELLSAARHDPTILPALLTPLQKYREAFAQMISAGIQAGTLRRVDRELVAQMLVTLGFGLIMRSLLDPQGDDWGAIASRAIPLLLQGLEKR
jgi:hypothetical protein